MVGLAATSLVYEKWFRNNYYYLNPLVTALIDSGACPETQTISLINCYIFEYTDCIWDLFDSKNKLSIYHDM